MVMKEAWLQLVLNHLKTVELRGAPAPLGSTWLGCNGQVHGMATIASCALVTSEDFEATRTQHRHLGDMPRFKKTYALALKDVIPLRTCVDYYTVYLPHSHGQSSERDQTPRRPGRQDERERWTPYKTARRLGTHRRKSAPAT